MIQTGIKQAVVMYRVRAYDQAPLDSDGMPIVIDGEPTGRKQAIAILEGTENPNPALYDVQIVFGPDDYVQGVPSTEYNEDDCARAVINLLPQAVILTVEQPTATITVSSSHPWELWVIPPQATFAPQSGPAGDTIVTITRTAVMGTGNAEFRNLEMEVGTPLRIDNLESTGWILETGAWRMFRLWKNNGLWKFN